MNFRFILVAVATFGCICGCWSQNSTAGGAAGTDGGATGSVSTGTRPPPAGPRGEDICRLDTLDALLHLNLWNSATIRTKLQRKPATVPPGSPCAAMQESCCKPELETLMVKELVRPHYKQRCANATRDNVGTACWRIGRRTRQALYNIIADGFKMAETKVNSELNATLNKTLQHETFGVLLKYMSQFVYTSNICHLNNETTGALRRMFDNVYQLQGPGKSINMSTEFQVCYEQQANIYLQKYSSNAINALKGILSDLRLFNHALILVEQVLHTVAGHQFPEECLKALPDLQHCAYCGGYGNPKPCLTFCLNTMRGCFANIAALKDDFSRLTSLLSSYAEKVIAVQWQPTTLVDSHLSALVSAVQNMMKTNLTLLVSTACTHNLTSNESTPTMASPQYRGARAVDTNSVTSVTGTGMAAAILSNAINEDLLCVRSVETLLDSMPEELCSRCKNPLSSGANDYCWNGSNVGSYLLDTVDVSRDDQVNNPVFQLNLSVPYQYQSLSDTIRSTIDKLRYVLDCLVSDDEDCNSFNNFYTCVLVTPDNQDSGSGQSPGNGFEDIEDFDVQRSTSAPSTDGATRSSGPPTLGGAGRGTVGTNGSAPTTSRGSVTTRVYNTLIGDINITVDTSDTPIATTDITTVIINSTTTTDVFNQPSKSGSLSNISVATICFGLLQLCLWM